MFDVTIVNILSNIWPMLVILIVILASYRIGYIIKYKEKVVLYREVLKLGFIIYVMCLFYVVTFQDVSWATSNFIPFKEMFRYNFGSRLFLKNVLGNLIMFAPYGFFISYFLKLEKKRFVLLFSFLVSITIETTQFFIGRVFDVDDIMLNMLGGLMGYYVFRFVYIAREKLPKFLKNNLFYNLFVSVIIFVIVIYILNILK